MKTNLFSMKKLALAMALVLSPVSAFAGTMTGGATMPEQIVQEATLIESKVTEAQQLVQQIQQYENMVQNMATIPSQLMSQITQSVSQLDNLASQAQSLGTAGQNISSQFQNMNPNFSTGGSSNYASQYGNIMSDLDQSINNALQTANMNPSNFLNQQQAMAAVTQAMQNPTSRNAILQAGVTVGQAEVSDLTQMAQTANTEETMQAAYLKKKAVKDAAAHQASQEAQNDLWGTGNTPPPTIGAGPLSNMQPID